MHILHAIVLVDGVEYETWLNASYDLKAHGESKMALDTYYVRRMRPLPGGHEVRWGESLEVLCEELAQMGEDVAFSPADLGPATEQLICDTGEAASLLGCTRQNVSDLMRRGKLTPMKATGRTMLFLRSDVLARL